MKVEVKKGKEFSPITLIIETEEEANCLNMMLSVSSGLLDKSHYLYDFAVKFTDSPRTVEMFEKFNEAHYLTDQYLKDPHSIKF